MKFFSSLVVTAAFAPLLVSGDQTLDGMCGALKSTLSCKSVIRLPSGLATKTCTKPWGTKWNGCKTHKKVLGKKVCVPGTEAVNIQVPCGIDVTYNDVNTCKAIGDALGVGNIQNSFSTATSMCDCLPKVMKLIADGTFDKLEESGDMSLAISGLLLQFGELGDCFVRNGFAIKDNKQQLLDGVLSNQNDYFLFTAKEIGLPDYATLAADIAICAYTGDCDLIRGFFTNYVTESQKLMTSQVKNLLNPWEAILNDTKLAFAKVESNFESLKANIKDLKGQVTAVEKKLCKDPKACARATYKGFKTEFTKSISELEAVLTIEADLSTAIKKINYMRSLISAAVESFEGLPASASELVDMILSGEIRKLEDIVHGFQALTQLPALVKDLQKSLKIAVSFTTNLQQKADSLLAAAERILSKTWLGDSQPQMKAVNAAIAALQDKFHHTVLGSIASFSSLAERIVTAAGRLPFHGETKLVLEAKVASYQRWTPAPKLDMPCSTTGTKTLTLAGQSVDVSYPKFYRCQYVAPADVAWPNHHIPYFRFKFE